MTQCFGTTLNDREKEIMKQNMRPAQSFAEINGVSVPRTGAQFSNASLANGESGCL